MDAPPKLFQAAGSEICLVWLKGGVPKGLRDMSWGSVDHIQTKWECLGGDSVNMQVTNHPVSFSNVLFLFRFIDLKEQFPMLGLRNKGNQDYPEEVHAGVLSLNFDSQWAISLTLGRLGLGGILGTRQPLAFTKIPHAWVCTASSALCVVRAS